MTFSRLWTIARLELLQRVRTVSWYVLLGVFGLVLLGVTALAFLAYGGWGTGGPGVYSVVVYVTLLLILLVSPTLSGNSINGDRDAATLAPVQVTLATTGEILFGTAAGPIAHDPRQLDGGLRRGCPAPSSRSRRSRRLRQ